MKLTVSALASNFAVCRLDAAASVPSWVRGELTSITRTSEELSIVCEETAVPAEVRAERGWRCFKVEGPIPFEVTGVAAAITTALASERISVFLVATFDTDYVLVKEERFAAAVDALRRSGIAVR